MEMGSRLNAVINMNRLIVSTLVAASLLLLAGYARAAEPADVASYDAKVKFTTGRAIRFPAFTLTYAGKRHVTPQQYPRGWWIYDFKIRDKSGEQTVSWSAGTGDIGPTRFQADGADFQIELAHSDKQGALREDELVISRVAVSR